MDIPSITKLTILLSLLLPGLDAQLAAQEQRSEEIISNLADSSTQSQGDTEQVSSAAANSQTEAAESGDDDEQSSTFDPIAELRSRQLSTVSLTTAQQSRAMSGEELGTPQDIAGEYFAQHAAIQVSYSSSRVPSPNRNLYPICHKPLYFEDPNLERCGRSFGIFTDVVSVARFGGRIPLVPYMMGVQPPCEPMRALPDCPTCHRFGCEAYVPAPNVKGITLEGAAAVGLIFLIP